MTEHPDRHQGTASNIRNAIKNLTAVILVDEELTTGRGMAIIAALDLAAAAIDYAYALSTGRLSYISEKRVKLEQAMAKVMKERGY